MAVADRMTGPDLVVHFITSGGGTINLTGDQRTLSVTREQEVADATAGADGWRVSIGTLKNASASLEALYIGAAGTATWGSVDIGAEGTLRYYPKGTATGSPKGAFPVITTNASLEIPYDDMVMLNIEFASQGAEIWNPLLNVV